MVSNRVVETAVSALIFALGALVVFDALRIGAGWGDDGPKAGYFPFYVGIILCAASAVSIFHGLRGPGAVRVFVERAQARLVLTILLPSLAYAIVTGLLGIYVASAIFVGGFMAWQGRFSLPKCIAVGGLVSAGLFLMFEVWFKVPLPKGPLEALFGY